jgi:hypothetical protein
MAAAQRRESRELSIGRRSFGAAGLTLELDHVTARRDAGAGGTAETPLVRKLRLRFPDGRRSELRPEAPHRQLLVPGAAKSLTLLPRSLDLRGETLTGTRTELCVLSYTSLVECGFETEGRVVKIDFPE